MDELELKTCCKSCGVPFVGHDGIQEICAKLLKQLSDLRKTLEVHGFTCTEEELAELWTSPRSARGVYVVVRFEDVFKSIIQWERHTELACEVTYAPADVGEMLRVLGIAKGGGA